MRNTLIIFMFFGLHLTALCQILPTCNPTDSTMTDSTKNVYRDTFQSIFQTKYSYSNIDRTYLNELYATDTNTFVRLYFTYPDAPFPGQSPGIVLVTYPMDDCSLDLTGTVLTGFNPVTKGSRGGTNNEITEGIARWRAIYQDEALQNFDPVAGYNFTWKTIFDACEKERNDLHIIYGVIQDTTNDSLAIHMILSNPSKTTIIPANRVFLDFALPCPKLCGQLATEGIKEED